MINNTMRYGIKNAPPPFSNAVKGNRQMLPKPTDIAMHDIKNSMSFPQLPRSVGCFVDAGNVCDVDSDTPFLDLDIDAEFTFHGQRNERKREQHKFVFYVIYLNKLFAKNFK